MYLCPSFFHFPLETLSPYIPSLRNLLISKDLALVRFGIFLGDRGIGLIPQTS